MKEDIIEKYYKNYKKEIEQGLKRRSPAYFDDNFKEFGQRDKFHPRRE